MSATINYEIDLFVCTNCGAGYGIPQVMTGKGVGCPMCAKKKIDDLQRKVCEEQENGYAKDRRMASLKGTITRMKNANKSTRYGRVVPSRDERAG